MVGASWSGREMWHQLEELVLDVLPLPLSGLIGAGDGG
jgi:hypothetical protein